MSKHNISHADELSAGAAYSGALNGAGRGVPVTLLHRQIIENPVIGVVNGLVIAAVTPVGDVPLDGSLSSDGVAVLDHARGILVDSSGAGDVTQTVTITGTDISGQAISEDISLNGVTAEAGFKAFKTVTAISVDIVMAGNLTVGTTDVLGLDVRLLNPYDLISSQISDGTADAGTLVVADQTSPVTNATGDRRGTYDPAVALDGIQDIILYYVPDLTSDGYGNNARN